MLACTAARSFASLVDGLGPGVDGAVRLCAMFCLRRGTCELPVAAFFPWIDSKKKY